MQLRDHREQLADLDALVPGLLITGATGLLGTSLGPWLEDHTAYQVIRHGHTGQADVRSDLVDMHETTRLLDAVCPDVIINLVALTSVDECEACPDCAYRLNVRTVENLVHWLEANPTSKLVHISTDQVYDGSGPHAEGDVTITNIYAFSKYAAELAAMQAGGCVLRTNFFGRSAKPNRSSISDWLLSALRDGKTITGFTDVCFTPLRLHTLNESLGQVVSHFRSGIYNLGSSNGLSKADFAHHLAMAFGLDDSCIVHTTSDKADLAAYRPKDMRMDSSLFQTTFNLSLPSLDDEILKLRDEYNDED